MKELKCDYLELKTCNIIKVFMMLSVIITHCCAIWSRDGWFTISPSYQSTELGLLSAWLGSFHTYVFTFVSGYLFYYLKYEKKRYVIFWNDVERRAARLLIPYVFVALIWIIPFYKYFYQADTITIIRNFVFGIAPSQLWFLMMLFVLYVLFYILSEFFEKHSFLVGFLVATGIYILSTIGGTYISNYFQVWTATKYLFFYYIGFSFRKYGFKKAFEIPWIVYLVSDVLLFALLYYVTGQSGRLYTLAAMGIKPICNLVGTLMVVIGCSKFSIEQIEASKIYQFLLKHNFTMYLFHQQIIWTLLWYLNDMIVPSEMFVVDCTVSILGSLLLAFLLEKIPVVRTLVGYK